MPRRASRTRRLAQSAARLPPVPGSLASWYPHVGSAATGWQSWFGQVPARGRWHLYARQVAHFATVHVGQESIDHCHRDVGPAGAPLRAPALLVVVVGTARHLRAVATGLRRHGGDDTVAGPL